MRKNIGIKPAIFPMPVLMIATYNEDNSVEINKEKRRNEGY